jgi:hypothetical protein
VAGRAAEAELEAGHDDEVAADGALLLNRRTAAAGLVVAVPLLAGCGGGGGGGGGSASPATITSAATKTARAGSLKSDFTIAGAGAKGKGTGTFNTGADRSGRSTMDLQVNKQTSTLETIVTGNVLYMRSRVFAQAGLTGARQWVKLDLGQLAQQRGLDLSSLVNASPTPTTPLAYLQGAKDVKKVGTETVAGVETTHYKVTVDLSRAQSRATGTTRSSIKRVIQLSRRTTLPMDTWVDGQGYLRKVAWAEHTSPTTAANVTMVLHDFGPPVTINPPSGKVVDLLQSLGGSG